MKNFKYISIAVLSIFVFSSSYAQESKPSLQEFYTYNPTIEHRVDEIFNRLNDTTRVAQMIVTSAGELGKPESEVLKLAKENKIGGVVFLKGTKENHKRMITNYCCH